MTNWGLWDWLSMLESVSMVVIAGAAIVVAWTVWINR